MVVGQYKLVAPDGGWGYAIVASNTVILTVTFVPVSIFGIIFLDFLAAQGDATSSISMITSTFTTISFFMGIASNVLLNKYSFRKVALLGSMIHFTGALSTLFASSRGLLLFTFGTLQGIGYGLMLPASFSAFNVYFDRKMAFWVSVSQTLMILAYMTTPYIGNWCLANYGFTGSLLLLAGMSAFSLPAALALQPVKWHLKKEKVDEDLEAPAAVEPLLLDDDAAGTVVDCTNNNVMHRQRRGSKLLVEKIGSAFSLDENSTKAASFWQSITKSLDLGLLKDPKYLNIAIGLALSFTAEIAFIPILPAIMATIGFNASQIALMLSVFFGCDLAARTGLSIVSAFCEINGRLMILVAITVTAVLRTVLILNDTLYFKLGILAAMGFTRGFIQTPPTLVISSNYPDNFESAYSVGMVVNGVVSLTIGALIGYVKSATNSDVMVCHLLTAAFVVTTVSWGVEMFGCRKGKRNSKT